MAAIHRQQQVETAEIRPLQLAGTQRQQVVAAGRRRPDRRCGGSPAWKPWVPALPTAWSRPAAASLDRITASAVGERQMLPVQTNRMRMPPG
jgi:hypothetical protein